MNQWAVLDLYARTVSRCTHEIPHVKIRGCGHWTGHYGMPNVEPSALPGRRTVPARHIKRVYVRPRIYLTGTSHEPALFTAASTPTCRPDPTSMPVSALLSSVQTSVTLKSLQ